MKTKTKIEEMVKTNMAEEARRVKLHQEIADLLREKFDGKKLAPGWMVRHLRTRHPDWTICERGLEYGQFTVEIGGGDSGYSSMNRASFFIGYTSELARYKPELFEDRDTCNGNAAIERNKKRQAFLDSGKAFEMANIIDTLNNVHESLSNMFDDNQDHYSIRKLLSYHKER